jgi:hypothetical protein
MLRISLSCLFGAALALALVSGCGPATTTAPTGSPATTTAPTGGAVADVLVFEVEKIDIAPGTDKDVKVKAGKPESAEAPKDAGLTAKVVDSKVIVVDGKVAMSPAMVTVSAARDAKAGTHEVKVKGGKKDATIKVKVKEVEK